MIGVAVLAVGILAAGVLAVFVLADVRDRHRPVPPLARRDLEHYDADGRDDRRPS